MKTLACTILAATFALAATPAEAAKPDPTIDGLWIGSEVDSEMPVAVKINTEHNSMVFMDEYFVYFGTVQAKRKAGTKGGGKHVFRTKTTITSIVDIKGKNLPGAKTPAVSHAIWFHKGNKLKMCAGGPGSKIVPKSAEKTSPQIRCFELVRA